MSGHLQQLTTFVGCQCGAAPKCWDVSFAEKAAIFRPLFVFRSAVSRPKHHLIFPRPHRPGKQALPAKGTHRNLGRPFGRSLSFLSLPVFGRPFFSALPSLSAVRLLFRGRNPARGRRILEPSPGKPERPNKPGGTLPLSIPLLHS